MSISVFSRLSDRKMRSFTIYDKDKHPHLLDVRFFPQNNNIDMAEFYINDCRRKLEAIIPAGKDTLYSWNGYICVKESDRYCDYRFASFTLTDEFLYTAYTNIGQMTVTESSLVNLKGYCRFENIIGGMDLFVLSFPDTVSFICGKSASGEVEKIFESLKTYKF